MGAIIVVNNSSAAIHVFVSKYTNSNGSDEWYTIAAGKRDTWSRSGWELVAFKNEDDSMRAGVYIPINKKVVFYSFNNIQVE